jgi:D-sedoheptulose 7-phosphate isomerase
MAPFRIIDRALDDAARALDALRRDEACRAAITAFAERAAATLASGCRLYACGNGGSMCDAMHFAQEWTGRFRSDRAPLPALAFSDPGLLSGIANDYGYEEVFARALEGHARAGDLLVLLSTSGDSQNLVRAAERARALGIESVGLLGRGGGKLASLVDHAIIVPEAATADRVQELHIKILHATIEAAEERLRSPTAHSG